MKNVILLGIVLLSSNYSFSQDYANDDNYYMIILDGEEAYINKETGKMIKGGAINQEAETIVLNKNYSPTQSSTHTVQKDENLFRIAKKYNVNLDALLQANNLSKNSTIAIGQTIIIPTNNQVYVNDNSYLVKKGDTLYSIAKKHDTTVNDIKTINNLSNSIIHPGQIIRIK